MAEWSKALRDRFAWLPVVNSSIMGTFAVYALQSPCSISEVSHFAALEIYWKSTVVCYGYPAARVSLGLFLIQNKR